jgi:thiol-disulfide isomerase/thioredoxin
MKKVLQVVIDLLCGSLTVVAALALAVSVHTIHNIPLALTLFELLVVVGALVRVLPMKDAPLGISWRAGIGASAPIVLIGVFALQASRNSILWSVVSGVGIATGVTYLAAVLVKQRRIGWAVVTVVAIVALYLGSFRAVNWQFDQMAKATLIDKPAPPTPLTLNDGSHLDVASGSGHVIVLDFWGTWCAACLAEMPAMEKLHERYLHDADVTFYAVNPGWAGDADRGVVQRFLVRHPISMPTAFAPESSVHQLGGIALPLVVVIDQPGHERFRSTGFSDGQTLQQQLGSVIESVKTAS